MADKTVGELPRATTVTTSDLFLLEQAGQAKSLTGQVLINDLATALDGHGGINSITLNDDYTLTFTMADETTVTTTSVRGATGAKGDKGTDGRAIASVAKISTSGLVDTYKISFSDNTSTNFTVTNGSSIKSIAKTGTNGLTDTYTVTLTDGTASTFNVKNGNGIAAITLQSGTHAAGTTDTYKITFDNGEFTTFSVYNGMNGTGSVVTVNDKNPDASGNVALTGEDIPMSASDDTTLTAAISARLPADAGAVGTDNLGAGVVTRAKMAADAFAIADNAGAHNAIYRGKYLGTSVTAAQWAAIANGTFADLYIGDYWTINEVNWRIAAFDYYYKTGDISCTTHHVVIVPETSLYTHCMNDTNITTGGYVGSKMYTEGLAQAKTKINNAFGSSHILSHRQLLVNAVTNGKPSGYSWYDSTVELMTEQNVYGGKIFGAGNDGSTVPQLYTIDKSQFPLFVHDPSMISNRHTSWLRNVVSAAYFASVSANGNANYNAASYANGVCPAFSIKS